MGSLRRPCGPVSARRCFRAGRPAAVVLLAVLLVGCPASGPPDPPSPKGDARPRPYAVDSPWNQPIPPGAPIHPLTEALVAQIGPKLFSDPTQYTVPVYEASDSTAEKDVVVEGLLTEVVDGGRGVVRHKAKTVRIPVPESASGAPGTDGHLVVVHPATGREWGLWRARWTGGGWRATNAYTYDTTWDAAPPRGFGSRGAGLPYLAGLVRRYEVDSGRIRHAVAFGFPRPSCAATAPASKSDGPGHPDTDLPEGARLQLDPALDDEDFAAWGLNDSARVVARALQEYGMVVVDVSGRPKVYLEAEQTARWGNALHATSLAGVPMQAFRVLDYRGELDVSSCD